MCIIKAFSVFDIIPVPFQACPRRDAVLVNSPLVQDISTSSLPSRRLNTQDEVGLVTETNYMFFPLKSKEHKSMGTLPPSLTHTQNFLVGEFPLLMVGFC